MNNTFKCFRLACRINIRHYAKSKPSPEMKYLNVAEKHDAAKTIAGLLSNGTARRREGYSVYNKVFDFETTVRGTKSKMVMTSVSGHLLHLEFLASYRSWRNIDPKALFDAPVRKSCSEDYQPIKRTLEREIRGCQGLIIWTDCDREGENIGFEIIEVCRAIKPNIEVHRAIFSEITSAAVRRALSRLSTPDKRQSDAVDIRTELDLRTGAAITRFQTLRLQRLFPQKIADKLISYGSCQIPTLGFVAERYKEIEAFVSEPFWKLKVLHTIEDLTVEFLWARNRLFDKAACEDYYMICLADPKATVESVTVKPKHKWRPTPMDTVEMEKLGSRKLKLSAKETMTIAEKLYTKGIISYPRTETNQFSKEFDLRSLVQQQADHNVWGAFAQRVLEWGPNPRNGNKSDQAHPPIHPTKLVTNLEGNEGRVYELIVRHFLACVSKDAVGSETVVHINIAGEKFTATGLCIYERNYLDVYIYDKWNAKQIHKYEEGQVFEPTEISMQEGATTAPPLLTEADLIALMEKHGIGTDATHAEHINTIKERGYIGVIDKGSLVPGVIGMGLYEGYDAMELALAKPALRAGFEADLKLICQGEKNPKAVLSEQITKYKEAYQQITEKISAMDAKFSQRIDETPSSNPNNVETGNQSNFENNQNRAQELHQCPKCKIAPLALKQKKNQSGYFIGCLNFPDCKNSIWLPDECKEPSVLEEYCQKCGNGYKLLKFKFHSSYYRAMFNAPHGWYKTCLRCDAQFRNNFNINLECVKSVGGIVASAQTIDTRSIAPETRPSSFTSISTGAGSGPSCDSSAGRGKKSAKSKKPNDTDTKTLGNPKRATKTTIKRKKSTDTNVGIRSFFTATNAAALASEQLRDVPLDEFFDSNDGFEERLTASGQNITEAMQTARQATASTRNLPTDASVAAGFTDDIAAAFAADDDDDLANFDWNVATSNGNDTVQPTRPVEPNTNNESFSTLFGEPDIDFDNYAWGSKARAESGTGHTPASKKMRLQTDTVVKEPLFYDDDEYDNGWNSQHTNTTNVVKCSGCHQPAKSCTVKRDGPNKDRQFYVCAKVNPCKFFEWANSESTNSVRTQAIHSHIPSSSGWGTVRDPMPKTRAPVTNRGNGAEQCNCGKSASSFIVRKDGPNKGRPFFSCANLDKKCGFFKWGDENDNQPSTSTATATDRSAQPGKSRKCGLCRQEGHTRSKCPRKSEFDY